MQSKRIRVAIVVTLAVGALFTGVQAIATSKGSDWPQFRGLQRDGVSRETGLADSWPEGGPTEVWRVPLGEGYSAISIVGDRLYTMYLAEHEGKMADHAAAFDAADGKEIWRVPLGESFETPFGNGPSSTPTVDGDTVYVMDKRGNFAALAASDGALRWKISMTEDYGAEIPTFGFAMSALVDGDLLIVESGGKEGKSWLGLNKKTGEVLWSMGEDGAHYNSPLLVPEGGKKRYVFITRGKIRGVDEKGHEVWSQELPSGETHAMPVLVAPNRIFASGAEGVGAHLMQIEENGEGASVSEIWNNGLMRNHFSSSVAHDGHIFGFDNATLKAISVEDAGLAWAKRGLGKGSLILADGKLLVLSDRGKLLLVEATGDGYTEKGSVQALEGRCWTAPSLSNGRLYLRNDKEMVVYDLTR